MADIISFPGRTGLPRLVLNDLWSALRDLAVGQHVEHAVHAVARRIADDARSRRWTTGEADEILGEITDASGLLQDAVGRLQTSYLVSDDDGTLERCAVLAGALSLVQDAGAWIRLSAGLEAPEASDGDAA